MTLPAGTFTFLFSDIEGSTRLWEARAEQMSAMLARHDALLDAVITANGGRIFNRAGDGVCAVFGRAEEAVEAALAAQLALIQDEGGLSVRMAVHTGSAEERLDDYFGPALNRVARLLAAGHGGQVLLSNSARALVCDVLPPGVHLLDLGEHRLKDLTHPERVFQLASPDLRTEFPALRSLDSHPNNLPQQPSSLIGRERETSELVERLQQSGVRLLTLTGPGGTGKTRLALQASAEALDQFNNGVLFVDLAVVADPSQVAPAIARTLGLREEGSRSPVQMILEQVRGKKMLLVLDNFEHLVGAARQVVELLAGTSELKVMVTSRVPLNVRGEREYAVPPLALPSSIPLSPEGLSGYAAIRLFIERAQDVQPHFRLSEENAHAVAEICRHLDGLPLAIELAARRIRVLPPDAILARLDHCLRLLSDGPTDLPSRQRTLRAAIQ